MRSLASIQKVIEINPIPGADAIEVAKVLGWNVVIKKNEFKVGDLVVYFEIDSLLPLRKEFAFLQAGSGIKKILVDNQEIAGIRLKTVKLRGQISQGLVMPLSILYDKEGTPPVVALEEGTDVTTLLNVYKYDIPLPAQLAGKARGNFPGFLPKTDETRIQAFPAVLERWKDTKFFVTEKLDGSSCTFTIKNDEFHVCSRNLDLLDDGVNTLWKLAKELKIEEKLREFNKENLGREGLAIQGEVVGEGIQGNKLKIKGNKIYFYNAYDFVEGRYFGFEEFVGAFGLLGLEIVPIINASLVLPKTVDEVIEYATQRSTVCPDAWAEGYVFRPKEEQQDPNLGRLSFKAINPKFLLKFDE